MSNNVAEKIKRSGSGGNNATNQVQTRSKSKGILVANIHRSVKVGNALDVPVGIKTTKSASVKPSGTKRQKLQTHNCTVKTRKSLVTNECKNDISEETGTNKSYSQGASTVVHNQKDEFSPEPLKSYDFTTSSKEALTGLSSVVLSPATDGVKTAVSDGVETVVSVEECNSSMLEARKVTPASLTLQTTGCGSAGKASPQKTVVTKLPSQVTIASQTQSTEDDIPLSVNSSMEACPSEINISGQMINLPVELVSSADFSEDSACSLIPRSPTEIVSDANVSTTQQPATSESKIYHLNLINNSKQCNQTSDPLLKEKPDENDKDNHNSGLIKLDKSLEACKIYICDQTKLFSKQSVINIPTSPASLLSNCVVSPEILQSVDIVEVSETGATTPSDQTRAVTNRNAETSVTRTYQSKSLDSKPKIKTNLPTGKSENRVAINSHYSKEQIDQEVQSDKVFGLVSALVKFSPDLTEDDYTEVSKATGITVIMLDKKRVVVHGSWQAVNRAYTMIEMMQNKRKEVINSSEKSMQTAVEYGGKQTQTDVKMCDGEDISETLTDINGSGIETEIVEHEAQTISTEEDPNSWPCADCKKVFWTSKSLQDHVTTTHGQHACHVCGKFFMKKRYLQTHMKRHANFKKFSCEICGWKFLERHKLKLHMETHKSLNERTLPYKCEICEKQFYNKAGWTDHLNTHTGNRPYECKTCAATFSHRIGLKRHQATHTAERPFKCRYCEKGFPFKSKLDAHMTLHTGTGRHSCPVCEKIFTVASSLRRHMETCQPYSCSKCGQTFLRENTMTHHLEVCAGVRKDGAVTVINQDAEMTLKNLEVEDNETVYMCGMCGQTFESLEKAETHTGTHDATEQEVVLSMPTKDDQSVEVTSGTEHIVLFETDTATMCTVVENNNG